MEGRPRVVLLVDRLDNTVAGAERTVLGLGTSLPAHGFDVTVATTRAAGGWPLDALREAGARHVPVLRRGRFDLGPLVALGRRLRAERVDVVHAHMFGSNVWGTLLGRLAGVPVVVAHEHSWAFEGDPGRRVLEGIIGRTADALVAVSRADAELMHSYERVPRDRIRVIPSAWTPRDRSPGGDLRADHGIPPDAVVVGTVAHLRRVKRLELLVEAFAMVLAEQPDAWLLIVGEGPDRPRLEAAARRWGVEDRTAFTGHREDVDAVWTAIDVAAMTSDREGTPTAALEAMTSGTPMVAFGVGGLPELFAAGGGVLVPPHDTAVLARELAALAADPQRRRAIGAEGRARSQDYTLERQVARCAALYRELLETPAARRRAARRDRGAGHGTA